MDVLTKIKLVLTKPTELFKKIEKKKGIKESYKYFAIITLVSVVFGFISVITFPNFVYNLIRKLFITSLPEAQMPTIPGIITALIAGYILALLLVFVSVALLHIWIKIFRGKGKFEETFKIYSYGTTPSSLLSWIPLIGLVAWIYDLVLLIIGTSILHKISRTRSTVLYLIPVVISALLLILIITAVIALFSYITSIPGSSEAIKGYINFM